MRIRASARLLVEQAQVIVMSVQRHERRSQRRIEAQGNEEQLAFAARRLNNTSGRAMSYREVNL
jgi:hypothetical protein